ncbi:esterase [Mycobacterium sp. 1274761.0]|uniref:esterase n=1 Tax=Mycobacterium sp. 1274761.0 TaxID=1834077 RepID=UPI0007FF444A|nr:esterase [Mycobacterium sp. 1274761.0]OBK74031.1 esterase [Mycobacterium sp. 1274761.0]
MKTSERAYRIGRDFAGVLPRAHAALKSSGDWKPLSPIGARQLGEVMLDELALSGMTLTAPPPKLERTVDSCQAAAEELSALGVEQAHSPPNPLQVRSLRRRRLGRLTYEKLTFDHEPVLPPSLTSVGLGGAATALVHLCRTGDDGRPWLVWVHGAGQGQPIDLLFSHARRIRDDLGFNIALPVQPGHGARRTAWPPYPNMDPLNNIAGMMRVVSEVRALVQWLRPQSAVMAVSGVSMGSPIAALVSHFEEVDGVAVYTPITGLNAMISQHLHRWGPSVHETIRLLGSDTVAALASVVDHTKVDPTPPPRGRLIVGAWHDQMARREAALQLHQRWGGELVWHKGSHVGHLFAKGVQRASERFLRTLTATSGIADTN